MLRQELTKVKQAFVEYREMSEAALLLEGASAAELRAETGTFITDTICYKSSQNTLWPIHYL